MKRLLCALMLSVLSVMVGCASMAIDEADRLARGGEFERAYATLDQAVRERPGDPALQTALARSRDRVVVRALSQAELALASGRVEEARRLLDRVRSADPRNTRLAALDADVERVGREQRQADARRASPAPAPARPAAAAPRGLGPAFQKPVTLEFRDAPLRQVFESLARGSAINFVFDKDVRGDTRITIFLRGVSLDEGMRVILATQQLDRKLLNDNTVLIFPNTPAKQREHQELVTRSLYLVNADVKQALALARTIAKTRDMHADERLNALVIRDTPEVVNLVERLLATIDMPEPEVTLAVEVLEIASNRVDELGIAWPEQVNFGIPNLPGQVSLSGRDSFRGSVANPAVVATLKGTAGTTNLLANPTIRARNHEKAKVQIGEKLPVFTTSAGTVNVGASTTVTLLDVGLKLDIEPAVQLDGEVTIKLALEVSNLIREVKGPNGSVAYQLGTRLTTTSLRLRDGETQVLAGLINDEDRKSADGLPGLAQLPLIGRLFGVHGDTRNKTEIVMLITPRIVRNLVLPDPADAELPSGTDALPGAATLRLRSHASAAVATTGAGAPRAAPAAGAAEGGAAEATSGAALLLSASAQGEVGETVSVTLSNRSALAASGEIEVDPAALRPASTAASSGAGRVPFAIEPGQDAVLVFRVLPAAAGTELRATVVSATGTTSAGEATAMAVEGAALIRVKPQAERKP